MMWYAFPLIISISLVYAATRHEEMEPILRQAARSAIMITIFMAVILAILFLVNRGL